MLTISELSPATIIQQYERQKGFTAVTEIALAHLSSFIAHISPPIVFHPLLSKKSIEDKSNAVCAFARDKWTNFTTFCEPLQPQLVHLSEKELKDLFFDFGPCQAAVVQYFSQLDRTGSPTESIPLPIVEEPMINSLLKFYPIRPKELQSKTRELRFLMAAFKMAVHCRSALSLEYFPEKILDRYHLKPVSCLPSLEEGNVTYAMKDILKVFKDLNLKNHFLLSLAEKGADHAIALHLQSPYHFFDPAFGLAVSENKEEFFLFLVSYLTTKYPGCSSFRLLEFASK